VVKNEGVTGGQERSSLSPHSDSRPYRSLVVVRRDHQAAWMLMRGDGGEI